ncbi:MAG: tetratricopeptide repeat protein [Dysosmobacter sp.]
MKRICSFLLTLILLLGLTACGQGGASSAASASGGPTWQEQYDLGVRYLSEGSYAEAILAFTAAIDIDPKRPDAFIGRGDAYVGTAQLAAGEDAAELPEESRTAYESAVADYLAAIGLDKLLAAVYGKAADVYLALGDREAALAILQQGVDATGDADLSARLTSMRSYGNRWDSAFWSWDGYTAYDDSSGELIASYQATEYNEQGLPVAGVLTTDQESIACKIEWNDLGQMVLVSQTGPDWSSEYSYSYDEQGRVLPSEAQTFEYDDQGRVVRETYTEQDFVIDEVYIYDGQGRVVRSVERNTDAWGTSDYTTIFAYND